MWKLLNIDQDENDAGGGAGGGAASQAGGGAAGAGAGDAGGAGASNAQAGAGQGAASQNAGTDDKTNQAAAWTQRDIVWNGQKIPVKTEEEAIALMQKGYNFTQGQQEIAKIRKDLIAKSTRFDQLLAELEKNKPAQGEGEEADDPVKKLGKDVEDLRTQAQIQQWDKAFGPVKQKYPGISEKVLIVEFQDKIQAGEVEDSAEGLMKTAESLASERTGIVNRQLDELLAKADDPRITAFKQKVIADYVAGKTKLADAGGEHGGSGGAGGAEEKGSISEIAARIRAGI